VSWEGVDPEFRTLAERVCTPRQVDVLKLKSSGAGWQRIAQILGLSKATVREHFSAASLRIRQETAALRGVT
jgi:DNA-binding NarL/FixJ family response regulator